MKRFIVLLFVVMVGFSMVSNVDAASRALKVWEYPLDSGCLNTMLTNDARVVRVTADQEYDDIVPCPPCIPEPAPIAAPAPMVAPEEEPAVFTVYFDFDKSNIKASEQDSIDAAAAYVLANPDAEVVISEGHCDVRGSDDYNMALGMRRAVSVKDALIDKDVPAYMIKMSSKGESDPVSDIHWENRRVHIIIK